MQLDDVVSAVGNPDRHGALMLGIALLTIATVASWLFAAYRRKTNRRGGASG